MKPLTFEEWDLKCLNKEIPADEVYYPIKGNISFDGITPEIIGYRGKKTGIVLGRWAADVLDFEAEDLQGLLL